MWVRVARRGRGEGVNCPSLPSKTSGLVLLFPTSMAMPLSQEKDKRIETGCIQPPAL